jgi:hypothetical protein
VDEVLDHLVHKCLEHCQHVGEAERHDQKLEVTVVHLESCLLDVRKVHANLVAAVAQVQLGEEARVTEFVE